jgi:hypothetical protein
MNEKQVKERISELKKEISILEGVLNNKREGFGRPKGSLKYSKEEELFLKENKYKPMKEIVVMFNKKFGKSYKKDTRALYNFMSRQGII